VPRGDPDPNVAGYIKERPRRLAVQRSQVEETIGEKMARGVPHIAFYH